MIIIQLRIIGRNYLRNVSSAVRAVEGRRPFLEFENIFRSGLFCGTHRCFHHSTSSRTQVSTQKVDLHESPSIKNRVSFVGSRIDFDVPTIHAMKSQLNQVEFRDAEQKYSIYSGLLCFYCRNLTALNLRQIYSNYWSFKHFKNVHLRTDLIQLQLRSTFYHHVQIRVRRIQKLKVSSDMLDRTKHQLPTNDSFLRARFLGVVRQHYNARQTLLIL